MGFGMDVGEQTYVAASAVMPFSIFRDVAVGVYFKNHKRSLLSVLQFFACLACNSV